MVTCFPVTLRRASAATSVALLVGMLLRPATVRAQVGRWEVHGTVSATVRVNGRIKHSYGRMHALFLLFDDGTYQQPGNLLCNRSDVTEEGTWQTGPGRKVTLAPSNLADLETLVSDCVHVDVALDQYKHQFHLNKRGTHFSGITVVDGSVGSMDQTYPFHATARYRGTRVSVSPLVQVDASVSGVSLSQLVRSTIQRR